MQLTLYLSTHAATCTLTTPYYIHDKLQIKLVKHKMRENLEDGFEHVERRPKLHQVGKGIPSVVNGAIRTTCKPKQT